ncbi:tetratricopeptide repeat protein [Vulcanococcus limneticus]|uniref:tetratricopeptide repeat protein n=1 Tax=Vulcanococcus limneticus TaxID=2170428 RepID=UPI00398BF735
MESGNPTQSQMTSRAEIDRARSQDILLEATRLYLQGDIDDSEIVLDSLLAIDASKPEYLLLKTRILSFRGCLSEALDCVKRLLLSEPLNRGALEIYGLLLAESQQLVEAEKIALKLVELEKESPHALRLCAHLLQKFGNHSQALLLSEKAIKADPGSALAYYIAGVSALEQRKFVEAHDYLEKSLELQPGRVATELNLFLALHHLGRHEESFAQLKRSIHRRGGEPTESDLVLEGRHWLAVGEATKAIDAFSSALALNAAYGDAHANLGLAFHLSGDMESAIGSYLLAVLHSPSDARSHLNLGLAYLLLDNYENGWQEYEWRRIVENIDLPGLSLLPELSSTNDMPTTVLFVCEQGLGDVMQFARYSHFFREAGRSVKLLVGEKLVPLIQGSNLFDAVSNRLNDLIADGEDVAWLPIMSIPKLLGIRRDKPIFQEPYILIPEASTSNWNQIMACNSKLRVGIHWQGNPEAEKSTLLGRSMPLANFGILIGELIDIEWLSLQKGPGQEQMPEFSYRDRLAPYQDMIDATWDFVETGAIISNCDLIITTDSAMAHLAGAIGRPVWLLLTAVPDWRWGLEGESTPWYPATRLFRQRNFGDWIEVMERVKGELRELCNTIKLPGAAESHPVG